MSGLLGSYSKYAYALSRLREVGNRLQSPALADTFGFWRTEQREAALAELERSAREQQTRVAATQQELAARMEAMQEECERRRRRRARAPAPL